MSKLSPFNIKYKYIWMVISIHLQVSQVLSATVFLLICCWIIRPLSCFPQAPIRPPVSLFSGPSNMKNTINELDMIS